MKLRSTLLAFAALPLLACGDDTPANPNPRDTTGGNDTTAPRDTAGGSDTVAPTPDTSSGNDTTAVGGCDENGWTPGGSEAATAAEDEGTLVFGIVESYSSDDQVPYDALNIELYYESGAETGPRTITLGDNYKDCLYCVLIYAECPEDPETPCGAVYLAQAGTLDITENGGSSGNFKATLSNVQLAEVDIAEDFTSTVLPNGRVWCIDNYTFDLPIELFEPEADPATP
jgi:hypothetical protein